MEKEDKEAAEGSLGDKIRDYTKEKFALTPTNFSTDYGKTSGTTFDTSNGKTCPVCWVVFMDIGRCANGSLLSNVL